MRHKTLIKTVIFLALEFVFTSANGQVGLGFMYQYGNGVEEDHIEAVKWYRKATEQGSPNAQTNLDILLKD